MAAAAEVGGGLVIQTTVWSHVVVLVLPTMEGPLGVVQIDEPMLR